MRSDMWVGPLANRLTNAGVNLRSPEGSGERPGTQLRPGPEVPIPPGTLGSLRSDDRSGAEGLLPYLSVPHAEPQRDRLGPRVHADLLVDPREMVLHRLVGDEQLFGDRRVGHPARQQVQDLAL